MLIIGRKYRFTKFEKQRLKKANHKITIIRYRNRPSEEVLEELKSLIDRAACKFHHHKLVNL